MTTRPEPIGYHRDGRPIWPIAGGDGTDEQDETAAGASGGADTPPPATSVALSPEQVRATPEYQAQAAAARAEARARGQMERDLAEARRQLEETRTAAEASQREAENVEIRRLLGDEGVTEWAAIAELSASNPVEAARRFATFGQRMAQSQAAAAGGQPAGGQQSPPAQQRSSPPLPGSGMPTQPIGNPGPDNSWDTIATEAETRFNEAVQQVQSPATRGRFTGKNRAGAMMDFLVSSYAKTIGRLEREGSRR